MRYPINQALYFKYISKRYPFFQFLKKRFANRDLTGHFVRLYFSLERFKFYEVTALKAGYSNLGVLAAPTDVQDGLCIGIERKWLGSSIRVRFANANVLVERKVPIFAQYMLQIVPFKRSKLSFYKTSKAKLYYFNQQLLRKYLNIHYRS